MSYLISLLVLAVFALGILFAVVFGRTAERTGAALLAANAVLTLAAQATIDFAPLYCLLAIDLATFLGLAWLTFANREKLWPGLASCAQLLVAMFSATRLIDFPLTSNQYMMMVSVCSVLTVSALVGGTAVSRFFPRSASDWDMAYKAVASEAG